MNWVPIASIIVSVVAALASWAASRASSRASTLNATTTSRSALETEAYVRARKLDVETIERQDAEIDDLREMALHLNNDVKMVHNQSQQVLDENRRLREENAQLHAEVRVLRGRITRVERGLLPEDTSPIKMRETDEFPTLRIEGVENGRE